MDEMYAIIGIGLCIFAFLLILTGLGSFYGGQWQQIAQGVTYFIGIVVVFCFGAYVLANVMRRH